VNYAKAFLKTWIILELLLSSGRLYSADDPAPQIIGGRDTKDGEFPEVIYVGFGGGSCTASVVGSRVILSAAHCMRDGGAGSFQLKQNRYNVKNCRHHPDYKRQDVDLALCEITTAVSVKFAEIAPADYSVEKGDTITMVGYGCTNPNGSGGNNGVLKVGFPKVTGFSGHDVVTYGDGLCYGDSGGPAYVQMQDNFMETHVQITVNSKGNIRNTNYTARTYNKTARDFMTAYAKEFSVEICGINKDCGEPDNRCFEEKQDHKYLQSLVARAAEQIQACLKL